MFRNACKVIVPFTLPVILCRKTIAGQCSGTLGTFVVINDKGWIVTAGHIIQQMNTMLKDVNFVRNYQTQRATIKADASIDERERKKRINKLPKPTNSQTDQIAQVWGNFTGKPILAEATAYMPIDIAVGRLDPFNSSWVASYPVFKDPAKDFDTGVSLCRTGFPFHDVGPKWDNANGVFDLPPGTFPAPLFPIEGIFTRTVQLGVAPGNPPFPFPYKWLETSSPGLKGQSGGPIFDSTGTIWAIQCQTMSYNLGFTTPTPQFLNVGVGVHPETLFAVFNAHGIKFQVSAY